MSQTRQVEQAVARAIFDRQSQEGSLHATPLALARAALRVIEELGYQPPDEPKAGI